VEDAEHLDPLLIHDEVGDPIVPVRCLSNLTVRYRLISLPESRMLAKQLDLGVDSPHDIGSSGGIVRRDVCVNAFKATHRLERPSYLHHDSIASATSAVACVRPAVLSSGCLPMISIMDSFAGLMTASDGHGKLVLRIKDSPVNGG